MGMKFISNHNGLSQLSSRLKPRVRYRPKATK